MSLASVAIGSTTTRGTAKRQPAVRGVGFVLCNRRERGTPRGTTRRDAPERRGSSISRGRTRGAGKTARRRPPVRESTKMEEGAVVACMPIPSYYWAAPCAATMLMATGKDPWQGGKTPKFSAVKK